MGAVDDGSAADPDVIGVQERELVDGVDDQADQVGQIDGVDASRR